MPGVGSEIAVWITKHRIGTPVSGDTTADSDTVTADSDYYTADGGHI